MDNENLDFIKTVAQAATPNGWYVSAKDLHSICKHGDDGYSFVEIARAKTEQDARFISFSSPEIVLGLIEDIEQLKKKVEQLEKEADWLAQHALCHSETGRVCCPRGFRNITCKPFEEWLKEKNATGDPSRVVIIDRSTCMELGKDCWRESARKAVEEK